MKSGVHTSRHRLRNAIDDWRYKWFGRYGWRAFVGCLFRGHDWRHFGPDCGGRELSSQCWGCGICRERFTRKRKNRWRDTIMSVSEAALLKNMGRAPRYYEEVMGV